jgi:hypothetical protein
MQNVAKRIYGSKLFETSFLLAVVTAGAYLCAYGFELGYLRTFGLPYQTVEIRTITFVMLFMIFGYVCLTLYSLVGTANEFGLFTTGRGSKFEPVFVVCCMLGFFTFGALLPNEIPLLGAFVGIIMATGYFYLCYRTKGPTDNQPMYLGCMLAAVPLLLFFLALGFGKFEAGRESTFKIHVASDTQTRYIVVREYDSKIILAGIKGDRLDGKYRYILKPEKDFDFQVQNLRLKLP